jgi:hypothetical protein
MFVLIFQHLILLLVDDSFSSLSTWGTAGTMAISCVATPCKFFRSVSVLCAMLALVVALKFLYNRVILNMDCPRTNSVPVSRRNGVSGGRSSPRTLEPLVDPASV